MTAPAFNYQAMRRWREMTNDLFAECQSRLERTRLAMEAGGLDFLLVYAGGKREMQRMDGVRYLTGYSGLGEHALLLVGSRERPILFVSPPEAAEVAREETVLGELVASQDLPADAARVLQSWNPRGKPVGFIGQDLMPAGLFQEVSAQISEPLRVDNEFLKKVGRCKSPWEMERIRRAQRMADQGFLHMIGKARPGVREFELAAELERVLRLHGAADNFGLVASSKHNQAIRPPTERRLEEGDVIIAEISPECDGYFAQLCRTLVVGEPDTLLEDKSRLLTQAFQEGLHAVRPGARASDVARAVNRVIEEAGYETYSRPPYMRSRGHGLGQGSPLPGNLDDRNGSILEEGMTFIIHPNQYIPETGYVMLGETCVVTESGGKSFSSLEQRIFSTAN